MNFFARLFDTADFPARWTCGRWSSAHGWLHVISDLGVWSAYVAIPLVLGYFLLRRQDLPFRKIFLLFGAFILACGTTHLMEAAIFWWPAYRLAGLIKLFTAVVSWATVIALVPIVPRVLEMRSPEDLEREIAARSRAEAALQHANAELEQRVIDRTQELTHAVSALRDERELLRVTLASIGDAVIVTDAESRITFMNAVAEELTEWNTSDAQGRPVVEIFRIEDEATGVPVENPAQRALHEGETVWIQSHTVLRGKYQSTRFVDDSAAPIRDAQGQILGCVLVFRDIGERRRAEKQDAERLAAARTLASIVEFSEDAIIRKSLEGNIQSWNKAAERLFGYSAEHAIGRHISFLIPEDRAGEETEIIARLRSGRNVSHFDTVRVRQDGRRIDVALTISPIRDETTHEVIGISKIVRDITEEKRVEKRIYDLMRELRETDRRKDEFLATLAHELRNPLAPLRNSLEVMKLADGDEELIRDARSTMERQLSQMMRLVDDLLDISRITHNRILLRREKVDLAAIIQHAVEMCRPQLQCSEQQISVHLPDEPVWLNADPVRLAQVFSNLLNNACKFTSAHGRIWIRVRIEHDDVVVVIEDNGRGIPPDRLQSIFEMFTQIDSSLERTHGGLGIGLTLVRRLAELHGGSVRAFSDGPGKGSQFEVRLPILRTAPEPVAFDSSELPSRLVRRRVLVVDDNRDSAASLAMLLRLSGHDVRTAADGIEAVDTALEFQPDLILLDIGLPRMNGYAACRAIREQARDRPVTIVALTGWGQEEDRRKSREAGFNAHLVKPVDHSLLQELLTDPGSATI